MLSICIAPHCRPHRQIDDLTNSPGIEVKFVLFTAIGRLSGRMQIPNENLNERFKFKV